VKSIVSADIAIVGSGPCGALVAKETAQCRMSVVVLEAGRRFGGSAPLQNTEANAGSIMWSGPRNHVGADFVVPKLWRTFSFVTRACSSLAPA